MADERDGPAPQAANTQLEIERLRLDAQVRIGQVRADIIKVVCGTMIVGVAAAFFPFAQEFARSHFAESIASINTKAEFDRLQEKNRLEEMLETAKHKLEIEKKSAQDVVARRDYLERLAKEARSDRIETQIVAAEFFSFLAEVEMRPQWEGFRQFLVDKQKRLNEEKQDLLAKQSGAGVTASVQSSTEERLQQIERLQNPSAGEVRRYNLPMPFPVPGQSRLGRQMLEIALEELNSNTPGGRQSQRFLDYESVVGGNRSTPSALFISWLVSKTGNPHGLSLSGSNRDLWQSMVNKGLTKSRRAGTPVPGDIAWMGEASGGGWVGIVYAVRGGRIEIIFGNLLPGVSVATPFVTEFAHLPDAG